MSNSTPTETNVPEAAARDARRNRPFPRIEYSEHAFRGAGWYVEARRLNTYSIWEGPYSDEDDARRNAPNHLAPSDAERERVIAELALRKNQLDEYMGVSPAAAGLFGAISGTMRAIDTAIALLRTPAPLPHVETGGEQKEIEQMVRANIGEGVHACLRKYCDSPAASRAWNAINEMPAGEWSGVLDVVVGEIMAGLRRLRAPVEAAPAGVTSALRKLVERLELIHADPQYKSVWVLAGNRGFAYSGPTYTDELTAAKAALAAIEAQP